MIQKITKIICDNCKIKANYYPYRAIAQDWRYGNMTITRYFPSKTYTFNNEECYKERKGNKSYARIKTN